jgi:hypothetical protein
MPYIKTYDRGKGHDVIMGLYDERTKVFTREVKANHIMGFPNCDAIGIQLEGLERLKDMGCKTVRVKIKEGPHKGTYDLPLKAWLAPGIRSLDRGHGAQKFMPIYRMKGEGKDAATTHKTPAKGTESLLR